MATPKLTKIVKEKKPSQVIRGVQKGILNGTTDKLVEVIAGPLTDRILPKLHEIHPGMQLADPAVRSVVEFGIILAIAETLEAAAPMLDRIPGVNMDAAKASALALWLRTRAGEKLGEETVAAVFELVPLIQGMLGQSDFAALTESFSEQTEVAEQGV